MKLEMPLSWTEAANALADLLEIENTALRATDFTAATSLLPAKRIAIERLETAMPTGAKPEIRAAAARLDRLSRQNRDLLAEGIGVQGKVLGIIAGAVRAATAIRYGRSGQNAAGFGGYAFSAKA